MVVEAPKATKKRRHRVSGEIELMAAKAIVRRILEIRPGRRQAVVNMVGEYLRAEGHVAVFAEVPEKIDTPADDLG